ncbi:MAG: phosphoglycerate kinase [Flavobacteriales bacterium]|jgi:phosphoglycerate kinase|nr:phosphoglycerate kinase [Flavobacteriales bacterium]
MQIDNLNFENKKVIIRVDFNVPLDKNFNVTDDTRIRAALPTIQKVLNDGGTAILMSHLGRPKGKDDQFSLKHIVSAVEKNIQQEVLFINDCVGEKVKTTIDSSSNGSVILLENLRFYSEEKAGDEHFAQQLSELADFYINDAFGTAHRAHASTAVIAKFFPNDKCFGYLIEKEIISVDKVLNSDQKPLTAIVGGAKVSSKITIIERLLDVVDHLIIGGGMAYTFIKAQGGQIGKSLVENDYLELALNIIAKAKENNVRLLLPIDTIIADDFSNNANTQLVEISSIPDGWMGLDIGEKSSALFKETILNSKLILWNGPMGVFEMEAFQKGTIDIALTLAQATENGAFSLVGGGDSVAAINKFNLGTKVSHVSTGGGAMLEYLEGKQLPGIAAILGK